MPKVSICIPAYKEPELTTECLKSVCNQTFTDYEVIITDDSPDQSIEHVVSLFKDKIRSIKYYKNKETLGPAKNWNECIKMASGEYIKIIHRDDKFTFTNSLEQFVSEAKDNLFVFSGTRSKSAATGNVRDIITKKNALKNLRKKPLNLLTGNIIGAPSVTFFKKDNLFFDTNLKWLVDVDFYIRMLQERSFSYIPIPLMTVSTDGEWQITKSCQNKEIEFKEWFYLYNKFKSNRKFSFNEKKHLFKLIWKYDIKSIAELCNMANITNEKSVRKIITLKNLFR